MSYSYDYYDDEYSDHGNYLDDYDSIIDAHFEETYRFIQSGMDYANFQRSTRQNNTEYTLRRSASPQKKTTTTIKSPQTLALEKYKSDSEDSYDEEELAFYLDKSIDIDDLTLIQKTRQNDPQVAFEIGQKYSHLNNMHKAIAWYKLAAAKNHTEAQMNMGDYFNSKNLSKVAIKWYTMAYENGNAQAAYKLGLVCKQNKDKHAMEWFLKAFTNGCTKAASQIGHLYQLGELGISRNYNQAMEWYIKGDQVGDDLSPKYIGDMYNNGLGVKCNLMMAVDWYKKAYERGNIDAAHEIGELYYGDKMKSPHTEKEALKWYYRAAIGNKKEASDRLDDLLNEGYRMSSRSQGKFNKMMGFY
ncbi:HCP-like protein [Backusella circina FSU 941]|nr:HCP-like protein [Backusella circina FSU 941]